MKEEIEHIDIMKPMHLSKEEMYYIREALLQDQDVILALKVREGEKKLSILERLSEENKW